jgi:predicted small metal-binding protein
MIRIEPGTAAGREEREKMLEIHCRDLGMDCDQVITGDTLEEVKQKAMAHVKEEHTDEVNSTSSPEQLADLEELIARLVLRI